MAHIPIDLDPSQKRFDPAKCIAPILAGPPEGDGWQPDKAARSPAPTFLFIFAGTLALSTVMHALHLFGVVK